MIQIILTSICCLLSFLNLFLLITISNFLFRILVKDQRAKENIKEAPVDSGLVDLPLTSSYDPRFQNPQKNK